MYRNPPYIISIKCTLSTFLSPQRELVYDVTDQVRVRDLQEAIEREIRDHLMSLRSRFITRWNTNCGRTLHKMLIRSHTEVHLEM